MASNNPLVEAAKHLSKVLKGKEGSVATDAHTARQSRPHIPTGSVVLDYLIGGRPNQFGIKPCPGWPKGAISNIYGHESSGKTTVALMAAAQVHRMGGTVCFIDWENAIDLSYAEALGVEVYNEEKFRLYQPDTLEDGLSVLYAMVSCGIDLVILDSVGAPITKAQHEQKTQEQGDVLRIGALAAQWSRYLPAYQSKSSKTGTHIMGISQTRANISTFGAGKKTTEQGGKAWKFYSSVRISFQKVQSKKGKVFNALENKYEEQVVATKIRATVEKSKISASQQHRMDFWVVFGEGIDNAKSVLESAKKHGIAKGRGWLSWERMNGEVFKAQGEDRFLSQLRDEGLYEEFEASVFKSVEDALSKGVLIEDEDEYEDDVDLDALMAEEEE